MNIVSVIFTKVYEVDSMFGPKSDTSNRNHKFTSSFTRADDYSDEENIRLNIPDYKDINNDSFNHDSIQNAVFFIIRSTCDDDVHKVSKILFKYFYISFDLKGN